MNDETLPIACSLTPLEMPARLAEMASLGQAALVAVTRGPGSVTLRFRRDDTTRSHLEAIVDAEAQCCAFLAMELRDEPDGLALAISAPYGAEPILDEMVDAFTSAPEAA